MLHILLIYLRNGASVEPTELLEMSDVIVPISFLLALLWDAQVKSG